MVSQSQEIGALRSAQIKKRNVIIAAMASLVVLGGLMTWLMSGYDGAEYEVGSACVDECGVYDAVGWICVKQGGYCSRPCGETHPACPAGFICQQVEGAPTTVTKSVRAQESTYCIKKPS